MLWNNEKKILWSYIHKAFDEDTQQQLDKRHKLSHEHVNLKSCSNNKQEPHGDNIRMMTQIRMGQGCIKAAFSVFISF